VATSKFASGTGFQVRLECSRFVVRFLICLTDEDVNITEVVHARASQAVAFGAQLGKLKMRPAFTSLRRGSLAFVAALQSEGWRRTLEFFLK
jgi:hypothetical protein